MTAKVPTASYCIWFSQRNGSTLLSKALEDTGRAGRPAEYLEPGEASSLADRYAVRSYAEWQGVLWENGSSPNGVFGLKYSMYAAGHDRLCRELAGLEGAPGDRGEELFLQLFPNARHIYLTRRNKVRQAVSWWKAIRDQVWHLEADEESQTPDDFFETHYDYRAIRHLFQEAALRECAIQAFYSRHGIRPLTLVYEDMVSDFAGTIRQVLRYLGVSTEDLPPPVMHYRKGADERSEAWVQRFRQELQEEMGQVVW